MKKLPNGQPDLFGSIETDWRDEWVGMPEFAQEDQRPLQQIIVSFYNQDDVIAFAKLIGLKTISKKTDSCRFPVRQKAVNDLGYAVETKNEKENEQL